LQNQIVKSLYTVIETTEPTGTNSTKFERVLEEAVNPLTTAK